MLGQVQATYSIVGLQVIVHWLSPISVVSASFCNDAKKTISSCMSQKTLTRDNEDIPFRPRMYNYCVDNVDALK